MFRYFRIFGVLICFIFLITGCGDNTSSSTVTPSPTIASVAPTVAKVGDTVTITGSNFSTTPANNTVTFNGTAAVVTSSTSTQIVTTMPAGATTGVVTVSVGGSTATSVANITVTIATLASIKVTPSKPSTPLGVVEQFTATGTYSDNSTADLTSSVTWSSSDSTIASISNAAGSIGKSTPVATGLTTITASMVVSQPVSGTISGSTTLAVTPAALASIAVTPSSPSTDLNEEQQFTAIGTYTDNTQKDITSSVTWFSADTTVAVFGSGGEVVPLKVGTVAVSAHLTGVSSNTSNLVVTAAPSGTVRTTTSTATTSSTTQSLSVLFNTATVVEDDTYSVMAVSILQAPINGTASVNGRVVTYTPNAGFTGTDTIVVQETSLSGSVQVIQVGDVVLGSNANINTNTNNNTVTISVAGP